MVRGRSVVLKGPRTQRVFALLAVNCDEVVPFERVVGVLWDEPPNSARQQVHNVLSGLRRALEASGSGIEVVTSNIGYRLGIPKLTVDAFQFQARVQEAENAHAGGSVDETIRLLREALHLWRGSALSGLFSRQLVNAATVLNDQRLAAVEHLAELQLLQGDAATPVADLIELVEEFPFRESLRALLMKALHRSGRQVEALAVFEEGRHLLAEELGLDPGSLLQAAHQQVLAGDGNDGKDAGRPARPVQPEVRSEPELSGSGRRFLPRDIVEFTGRDNELRRLVADAGKGGTTALVISAINGMGGVGKTTLAVHLAHKLADDYPGGQYFIDLQGFSADVDPLAPAQALNLLLRNSGVPPELVPPGLEERSALWRSRLAGQRVLLLLDNAADASQVRPLLPGTSGTLVLISSRRRMASLEGAVPLPLDLMPETDAVSLFGQIIGSDRAAAEAEHVSAVIELCGHLPLAIQIAAARLRDRPSWAVADVVQQLRDQRSRSRFLAVGDRDVMGILSWSYRHLTMTQQLVFRLLSLHPGAGFDAHAIAALADLTLEDAAACLDELFEVNLLQQHVPGRYRFHDLVRDCSHAALEQHGDAAERRSATLRILDYYLRSASLWCNVIARRDCQFDPVITHEPRFTKSADSSTAAVELIEAEYRSFLAAIHLASGLGLDGAMWQLVSALMPYLKRLNSAPETVELYKQALRSARAVGSVTGESLCLMAIAHAHRSQGSNVQARDLAQQAIGLSRQDGDRARELYQRAGLGAMYLDDNLFDDAFACYAEALDVARAAGEREAESDLTNNLGVICRELGRFDEAQQHFGRTLALDVELNVPQSQALTLCNIGQILYLQGRQDEAADQFGEALRMSRSTSSLDGEAIALIGLSGVYRKARNFSSSLACGRAALEAARGAGRYEVEGDALNALVDTYLSQGSLEAADQVLNQARLIGTEYDSPRYVARAHEGSAHLAAARGDHEAAEEFWRKSLATYPGGVVDAAGTRRHLTVGSGRGEECWRCALVATPLGTSSP